MLLHYLSTVEFRVTPLNFDRSWVNFRVASKPDIEGTEPPTNEAPTRGGITRQTLLENAARIADTLQRQTPVDENAATLSGETVKALEEAGMFRLKLPTVLGGAEADPSTQILVIEALARKNPAAGWCAMVGATSVGLPGAFLAEEAIAEIFMDGRIPHGAIVATPAGRAEVVAGGYRLSGRRPFASGVRHSEWIGAGAIVKRNGNLEHRMMVLPTLSAEIHDNWQVACLKVPAVATSRSNGSSCQTSSPGAG